MKTNLKGLKKKLTAAKQLNSSVEAVSLSVLKNIYALVLGVVDAKYDSPNTRFMILTKVFSEIKVFLLDCNYLGLK